LVLTVLYINQEEVFNRKETSKTVVLFYLPVTTVFNTRLHMNRLHTFGMFSILLCLAFLGRCCSDGSSDIGRSGCNVAVPECESLQSKNCFGASLPYRRTAPGAFTGDVTLQKDVQASLRQWSALRTVPQCWEVIQPLLCSVYLPPCKVDGTSNMSLVQKPSREQCDIVQTRCRIVEMYGGWPEFLKCDQKHFSKGCLVSMK